MGRRRALLEKGLVAVWAISLALGTRYVFGQPQDFGPAQHLEYLRLFLPFSALVSTVVIVALRRFAPRLGLQTLLLLSALAATVAYGASQAIRPDLSVWWFVLLSCYGVATVLVVRFCRFVPAGRTVLLATVTSIGVVEALLGLLQFALGHTLGLSLLGEPVANDQTLGVAKIVLDGVRILRPMGTFPHANLFGAFGVVALVAASFATTSKRPSSQLVYKLSIGIICLGIIASFSRSAWLAGIAALALLFFVVGRRRWMFVSATLSAALLGLFFWLPLLSGRLFFSEQSQQIGLRSTLSSEAVEFTESRLMAGVGLRNFVANLEVLRPDWLPYELQPPHNVVLLLSAEVGLVGLGCVLVLGFRAYRRFPIPTAVFVIVLLPILLLDHYLVTLPQGIGILGLLAAICAQFTVPRGTATQKTELVK